MKIWIKQGNPLRLAQTFRQVPGMSRIRSASAQCTSQGRNASASNGSGPGRFLRHSVQTVDLQQLPFSKTDQRPRSSALKVREILYRSIGNTFHCFWGGRCPRQLPFITIDGGGRRRYTVRRTAAA